MSAPRILVVYATHYGQTGKIARRLDDLFTSTGNVVTLMRADQAPRDALWQDFAAVVVGGSVVLGRHQRSLERFVRFNRGKLNEMPTAFFSVSGSAASRDPLAQANTHHWIADFLRTTGWSPRLAASFGGALAFRKYNPLLRFVMKRIAKKEGLPTDTSVDHELTDWLAVERFAHDVAAIARPRPGQRETPANASATAPLVA